MHPGQDVLADLESALAREWLLGNGIGGFSGGTAAGVNARRTHGHLVVAGLHGRLTTVLLGFAERLLAADASFELAPRLGPSTTRRTSEHAVLESFESEPWALWRFRAGETVLEKSLLPVYGHHAVAIAYRHVDGPEVRISASPLVVARAPLELETRAREMRGAAQGIPGRVRIETLEAGPALTLWHNGAFLPARAWERRSYPGDAEEEVFVPGYVEAPLGPERPVFVIASTEDDLFRALAREDRLGTPPPRSLAGCVEALEQGDRERRQRWRQTAQGAAERTAHQARQAHDAEAAPSEPLAPLLRDDDPWIAIGASALELGLVRRGQRLTALGLLPGAEERGEHALRIVPALVTFRAFDLAREILSAYVDYLDEGLAPASFDPIDGTPRYGDPAPALWLISAAELYARRGGDLEFARRTLYPAMEAIAQAYRSGTRHGIRVDSDGILVAGEGDQEQKRADVNALWYHAQVALAQLARTIGRRENGAFFLAWAHEHQRRFNEVFWTGGSLVTAIGPRGPKRGLEPSVVLAVGLRPPLLASERAERVVAKIRRELWTPVGMGERPSSDRVSTEWIGPFASAYLRTYGRSEAAQLQVRKWLGELLEAVTRAGGRIPESFEVDRSGGSAARPSGEPVSILAAAEIARVWIEELDHEPGLTDRGRDLTTVAES